MQVFFISSLDFQANGAAQSRQRHFMEGLQSLGFQVILINPTRRPALNMPIATLGLPYWTRLIPRRMAALYLVAAALANKAKPGDIVFSFDRSQLSLLPALIVARLRRLRLLHEITEHPAEMMPKGLLGQVSLVLFERLSLPRLDGVLVISRALQSYVMTRAAHVRILRIPAMAAVPADMKLENAPPFTFVYAGSLSEPKDGVLSLIAAFAEAFKGMGAVRLDLLGYGSAAQKAAVRAAIARFDVAQAVTLFDPVAQADLPARLAAAGALVLCRPLSRQATHGFPTKLAEYLASGRPVVVTLTSDIGHYLRDGVSAFLVPPNDVSAFASAMQRVQADPAQAAQVGQAGHAVFLAEFEAGRAVQHLADWLRSEFSQPAGPV